MGMASDPVHLYPRHHLLAAGYEAQTAGEVLPDEVEHVLRLDHPTEVRPARVPARPEPHLLILHHEGGGGELLQVADVVVVEVGEDHERNPPAVHPQLPEALGGTAKVLTPAPGGHLGVETGVDHDGVLVGDGDPDEVVHGHRNVVRILAVEVLAAARLAGRVPDGVYLEKRPLELHGAPDGTAPVALQMGFYGVFWLRANDGPPYRQRRAGTPPRRRQWRRRGAGAMNRGKESGPGTG